MAEHLQLINRDLGMDPFVLVQIADVCADRVKVALEFGGGVTADDVRGVLLLTLSQMGPLSDAEIEELRAT